MSRAPKVIKALKRAAHLKLAREHVHQSGEAGQVLAAYTPGAGVGMPCCTVVALTPQRR